MKKKSHRGVAILEISALGAALVVLDQMEKAAPVRLLQAELNDYYGYVLKLVGDAAELRTAVAAAERITEELQAPCHATIIDAPTGESWKIIENKPEWQPLIAQNVVFLPRVHGTEEKTAMTDPGPFAIGLIETQGFTAVIEAIDTACKTANVEVIGKEKLGGGYITVLIKGDVAAVTTAVESGKTKVEGLGKLIAAHVIARPSPAVLGLLP